MGAASKTAQVESGKSGSQATASRSSLRCARVRQLIRRHSGGSAGMFRRHLDELFNRVHADDRLLLALALQDIDDGAHDELRATRPRRGPIRCSDDATEDASTQLRADPIVRLSDFVSGSRTYYASENRIPEFTSRSVM